MSAGAPSVLVGGRALLATMAGEPAPVPVLVREEAGGPEVLAAGLLAAGAREAILVSPAEGEGEALGAAGLAARAWLTPHGPWPRAGLFPAVLATDPDSAGRSGAQAWTFEPLTVADAIFDAGGGSEGSQRALFAGPASARRDDFLQPAKHRFDVLHVAAGAGPEKMGDLMGRCSIAIDLRPEPGMAPYDRVGPALAAGLLLLAETPLEVPGLVEGEHFLGFTSPDELEGLLERVSGDPASFNAVRQAGRAHAERLRASTALPRILGVTPD